MSLDGLHAAERGIAARVRELWAAGYHENEILVELGREFPDEYEAGLVDDVIDAELGR